MLTRKIIFILLFLAVNPTLKAQTIQLPEPRKSRQLDGLYQNNPDSVAITGGMVTRFPGDEPSLETIFIRNGKIESIGDSIELPKGTRIVDANGLHIYAGFIDAYHEVEVPYEHNKGTTYWNDQIRPTSRVATSFQLKDLETEAKRQHGIAAALYAPKDGIIKGQSSLILTVDEDADPEDALLKADVGQHYQLTVSRGRDSYPNSPMGAVALARQAHYDANWWKAAVAADKADQIESNPALIALASLPLTDTRNIFETSNELFSLRASRFAKEFGLNNVVLLGSGNEYRRIDAIAATNHPIILPVNFPKPPEVGTPESAADVSLESLMHWEHAPKNPAALADANVEFCFTAHGLKDDDDFLKNIRKAIRHGLDTPKALAALTTASAKILGAEKVIGKVEPGFLANLVITDKPVFDDDAKVLQTWVAGNQFEIEDEDAEPEVWTLATGNENFSNVKLELIDDEIQLLRDGDTKTGLKHANSNDLGIAGSFKADDFGTEGWAQLSITLFDETSGSGHIQLPDGTRFPVQLKKTDEAPSTESQTESDEEKKVAESDPAKPVQNIDAISKVNFPLGYAGTESAPENPGRVLIQNVTLWTCAADGVLEKASVLVVDGKIKAIIESGGALPAADVVIDGSGAHMTPGIIDCHSHMASDSGINESGQAITAEVRIGDMIDCDDITIYRQLAGGVTTSNILHGSANPIGGQNQVIKLRWGSLDEEMKFKGAPEGIKFALGENVKQSNWSNPTDRYPQTRMGVEQLFENAIQEAKLYRAKQKAYAESGDGIPPRVNLELEAIAEIVEGKRWIHCHSYRQDEILALIRLLDRYKIRIGTFQHILEGYKVADEMVAHGAMGSAFSDWWAYKYEVKDAIPHAGTLMHRRGVVMSFNSDDAELARHLNQEAAKAVRYGGLSFEEALKFVTINPAIQLRIDDRVGSIEVGKDADFVLWNNHPLSNLAIAQQTWIDGRKYYDRETDAKRHAEFAALKQQLIQKVLRSGEEMETPDKASTDPAKFWPRYDAFCHHINHEGHDHDDDHEGHDHD